MLRWTSILVPLLFSAAALAAGTDGRYEEAWMTRDGQVAVLVTELDTFRGFHRVSLELRTIGGDGTAEAARPLLAEKDQRWLQRRGEYELYRHDLEGARARVEAELLRDGWQPLRACPLSAAWSSWAEGERGAAAPPAGNVTWLGVVLRASVVNHGTNGRVELQNPANGTRTVVASSRPEVVSLGYGRRVRFDLYRVSGVALTADLEWTAVTVDSIVPVHAELAPRRQVVFVKTRTLLRELGIPLAKLDT